MNAVCVLNERRRTMIEEDDDIQDYKRPWVGLTDEETRPIIHEAMVYYGYDPEHATLTSGAGFHLLAESIEQLLKEKNT
jgi:hypothetical protein